jgi:Protein of unknown function (DUF1549)/Protein of unknown function (DUF1553)
MARSFPGAFAAVVLLLAASSSHGYDLPGAEALAATIDRHLAAGWKDAGSEPAPLADDAEFLRRVYLDVAGCIPAVAAARAFLQDTAPDKRRRLIERLLDGRPYVNHFVNVWRSLFLPEAATSPLGIRLAPRFDDWLRKQLAANAGYDRMVRELLTAPLSREAMMSAYALGGSQRDVTPLAFYAAKELKPENLAASTSRLFLGVRLECAQCHNHPFATWKREQFWGYATFFAGVQSENPGAVAIPRQEMLDKRALTIPGTDRLVQARFLDGGEPAFRDNVSPRETLAEWMTAPDNPYFARAAVNRLWFHLFGTGLIDPVDEMVGADHAASHPELLDELARSFADHRFDLKFLLRAILTSRAYQLTSAGHPKEPDDPQRFARRAVRGMSAEQLFDSVATAIGYQEATPVNVRGRGNNSSKLEFLSKFASQGSKPTDYQTSILQALALMNGKLVADATSLEHSETLAAVVDAPFMDLAGRIETLFLATLSRRPTAKELDRLTRYVEAEKDQAAALADVFWALLNSGEFLLNH